MTLREVLRDLAAVDIEYKKRGVIIHSSCVRLVTLDILRS